MPPWSGLHLSSDRLRFGVKEVINDSRVVGDTSTTFGAAAEDSGRICRYTGLDPSLGVIPLNDGRTLCGAQSNSDMP